jgi:tricorn protease-like protein
LGFTTISLLNLFSLNARAVQSASGVNSPVLALPYFSEPAISPDRNEIAFVSGGDIWTVAASGGNARLLISHPATEFRPVYSPDGRQSSCGAHSCSNGR